MLPIGMATRQSAEREALGGSKGPRLRAQASEATTSGYKLALCPMSLNVLIYIMGTISTLLPDLQVKVSPGQQPPLKQCDRRD